MEKTKSQINISLPEIIGGGYGSFWRSRKRYVVCKGSRASKKSTTAALKIIYNMMKYPLSNCLVVRKTAATLKDSCYSQLRWAINQLKVSHLWHATINPLQLTYIPTGQKILFRGTEDSDKIKSITVEHGFINLAWAEEAFELEFEEFDKIDKSLRAQMPEGYFTQWLITFNPTSSSSWLKSFFFDNPRDNVLALTTTYHCNEWLSDEYKEILEYTRIHDPEKYKVDGLGKLNLLSINVSKRRNSNICNTYIAKLTTPC